MTLTIDRTESKRRVRRVALTLVAMTTLTLAGCGTLVSSAQDWPKPDYFGGVRYDARVMSDPQGLDEYPGFALLDMPLSLVLDLAFLPFNFLFHMGDLLFGDDDSPGTP